jgi:hypothetical protein
MSNARNLADQVSNLVVISTGGSNFITPETLSASVSVLERDIIYSSSSPVTASVGTLWTDISNPNSPLLKVYNGTEWKLMSGAGGGGMMTTFLLSGA